MKHTQLGKNLQAKNGSAEEGTLCQGPGHFTPESHTSASRKDGSRAALASEPGCPSPVDCPRNETKINPPLLTRGGVTNTKPTISLDWIELTVRRPALNEFYIKNRPLTGEKQPGRPKGYTMMEKFDDGWIRKWLPTQNDKEGRNDYEGWLIPGSVPDDIWRWLGDDVCSMRGVKPTRIDVAGDFKDMGYPRPFEMEKRHQELKPRSKNPQGYIGRGEDYSQYWRIGKPGDHGSGIMVRIYEKAKQLISIGKEPDTDDWIRVEFSLYPEWPTQLAWYEFVKGRKPGFFGELARYYFKGPWAKELFPEGDDSIVMGGEPKEWTGALNAIKALGKQYSSIMRAMEIAGLDVYSVMKRFKTNRMKESRILKYVRDLEGFSQDDVESMMR